MKADEITIGELASALPRFLAFLVMDFIVFVCVWAVSLFTGPERMAEIIIDEIVVDEDFPDVLRGMAKQDATSFLLAQLAAYGEKTLPQDVLGHYKERLPTAVHQVVRRARFQDAAAGLEVPDA